MPLFVADYAAQVLKDSPALYWRLNEPSGTTANDSSGNGRNGTYNFAPTFNQTSPITADPGAKAVKLVTASTQSVSSTYQPFSAGTQRTFECWIKRASSTNTHQLWGTNGASEPLFRLSNNGDGPPSHMIWTPSGGGTIKQWNYAWPDNTTFHHLVLTIDDASGGSGRLAELLIDTVSQGLATGLSAIGDNTYQFIFGSNGSYPDLTVCEVAWYNTVLSSTRIAAHYNAATKARLQASTYRTQAVSRGANF